MTAPAASGHNLEEMHDETVALRVVWKAAQHQVQKNLNAQDVAHQRDRPLYGISDGDRKVPLPTCATQVSTA